MKSSPILILCAAALAIIPPAASFPTFVDRHPGSIKRRAEQINQERADAVKEAFKFAWDGYRHNAYPNDELRPVSNTASNSRNGWGATAVDSMSTAIIMELPEIVDDILEHISGINYSNTETMCSLFETTIRYLGGMLSAYDLLTGPHAHLASSPQKVDVLLEQSRKLADVLKFAFDTRTGIPANGLNITAQITDGARTNGIATIGTLVLEWTRLSDLTGNPEYARLTQHAESYLLDPQPSSSEPFPGLIGRHVNLESGLFEDDIVDWGGGSDSFYEYLLKMYVYDKKRFGYYKDRWVAAAESTIKHLKFSPAPRPDLTFVGSYSKGRYGLGSGHLNCFNGGNFLLGGQVLGRSDFKDFGLKLVEGCYATYNATASRIGPEGFGWDPQRVPNNQREFYNKNGFYITQSYYDLRPEVIESIYYAYRMTKDPKYQDWAWDIFVAINETTRTGTGFSSIADVNNRGGGRKLDRQESFLFAEVMKYSYLIHAPESEWQIAGPGQTNKYVYNTEAHPVKVFGAA